MSHPSLWQISPKQLEDLRLQMVKFAFLYLKNNELAEDVVQEAFVSAYKYADSFKGESALKTWVFAILKNKIVDLIKAKSKLVTVSELIEQDEQDLSEKLFHENGTWDHDVYVSSEWKSIDSAIYSAQFWQIFEFCLNNLPVNQARVFMMRTHLEMETEEICTECEISVANVHTLLYRSRLRLQVCLSQKWFGE
ncbi:sigma-70 family RNA polymerase sigma factor [Mannheimia granulomatis]|uniref:sigma-70 family RNA polymerase sigma factor n=1 Tax=Mannheimia granulomatis TaxID=85402 RepID=UPI00047E0EF6|nr:sigma-70 family RNA polymerase sigma factor [Mannheimia granulomatis]QLB18624.1 RNA polymerase subunit sigma [Mannheimia granulomatis]